MASGYRVNKQVIRRMTRDIQRELDRNPVEVPVRAEPLGSHVRRDARWNLVQDPATQIVNNYGPVVTVNGDHAQVAWGDGSITQGQTVEKITPGFEALAQIVAEILEAAANVDLTESERDEFTQEATAVLKETTKESPENSVVRRSVRALMGFLAPTAAARAGAEKAVTDEAAQQAAQWIEQLGTAISEIG